MAVVLSIIDTWNDYRKHHVLGTLAITGDYVSGGLTLSLARSEIKSSKVPQIVRITPRSSIFQATYIPGLTNALGKIKLFGQQGVKASTVITTDNTETADASTLTIGTTVYRFKNVLAAAYDVKIGASADATLLNLAKAINGTGVAGTNYFAGTLAHPNVVSTAVVDTHTITITAKNAGLAANSIATTTTSAHLSFTGAVLANGTVSSMDELAAATVPTDLSGDTFDFEAVFQKNL